ncbi:Tetraspanin-33 [Oopsacas minuta]|uniref:Tetraspanin n=1 Tax=Oopsacas minuta TaxID=111878 RepID=A0AAV7JUS0_9METZ|nr:Tetraspanin-33 [Oopsacas minuta]
MGYLYTILKYVFYLCNLVILLSGAFLILIGVYARINTSYISGDLATEFLNPGNYVIAFGALLLVFGLLGAIGSVREISILLGVYTGSIVLLIILELALVLFIFLGKEKVKELANDAILNLIENYRTYSDLTVVVDLIQTSLVCCGGYFGTDDWENNVYFNCSSAAISRCGVPTSCCREDIRINSQCGYNVRNIMDTSRRANVNNIGCIQAIEDLFNKELNIFIACLSALFILEIVVILISLFLIFDRNKKKNLRVIAHTNLENSRNSRVKESDWGIQ